MAKKPDLAVDSWGRNEKGPARSNGSEVRVERLVSRRVRAMSVVCLAVEDAPGPDSLRAFIARNAIALLSGFVEAASDPPSPHWLGRHSPRERVRGSGLWNDADVDAEVDSKFLEIMAGLVLDARSLASRPTTHWPNGPGASQRRMLPRVAGTGHGVEQAASCADVLRPDRLEGPAEKRIQCASLHGNLKCGVDV